ncbi:hypothetical protein RND81_14G173800 [Saponaria officinalis]|uniref:KIB1-4 beta-propeller domain-containing protein n=1 Tax=Saponaria officinalis TaxID=3572 RepID=A0AAW1GRR4_SAPOF
MQIQHVHFCTGIKLVLPKNLPKLPRFVHPDFTDRRYWNIHTTTVYSATSATSASTPWLYAAAADDGEQFLHPLTLNHHPINLHLSEFKTSRLTSFYHTTNFSFDKLVIPPPRSVTIGGGAILVLYGGGELIGRLPLVSKEKGVKWVVLSREKFDDIIVSRECTYVVDRVGRLYEIINIVTSRVLMLDAAMITRPIVPGSGQIGWRKRFVVDDGELYVVVRVEEKVFRVYKLIKGWPDFWGGVKDFDGGVLFVSKDCCFFMDEFGGREYENCIVFSESGFPKYGNDGWEFNGEDEIGVFRLGDGSYGRVGESVDFPEIDWSPPSWIFDVRELDEDDGGVQSDLKKSNREDAEDREGMELDSDCQDQEDEAIHSNTNIDNVTLSVFASVSALEEEVTRTLLRMNGVNEAIAKESARKNVTLSAARACTSSSTTKGYKDDTATAKFEGFDIRSDLVPILQKIWRKHGNVIEHSTMRSGHIIANALESLATMVQLLENNSVQSLNDSQADYLSSTLSDLKIMGFKVHWLVTFVEKAVKLHKSKALVDSLNKLKDLSSQVKERRVNLLDEVAKLTDVGNKLKKEMAKVSKLIPFSGQVKFDEPFGSGLT